MEWRPTGNPEDPVLPFPFTARQLAAFFLGGVGAEFRERFIGHRSNTLSEVALSSLGPDADVAREALREANRLFAKALEIDGNRRAAANWLLSEAKHSPKGQRSKEHHLTDESPIDESAGLEADAAGPQPLRTPHMAEAFCFVPGLYRALSDTNNHSWLLPARVHQGKPPKPSTWHPVTLAEILISDRKIAEETVSRAFVAEEKLKPWLALWQQARKARNAFGT